LRVDDLRAAVDGFGRGRDRALSCLGPANKVLITATSEAELINGACEVREAPEGSGLLHG
jgi:hypothetical protein